MKNQNHQSCITRRREFRRCRISLNLLAVTVLLLPQHSQAKTITAEGTGASENVAIRCALRNAVEQGVGMRIASESLVKNFQLVSDKILSHTDGYAKNYSILSSSQQFGVVTVHISADVAMDSLDKDLVAQKLLYEIANKPRIMLLFDERAEGVESFEKTAAHKFEEALLAYGFKIIEPEQFKETQEVARAKGLNDQDLATLGFRTGADLIIRGAVSVAKPTSKTIYGTQFYTVPVQLNAHIVKADNAQIIASKTKHIAKNSQEEASAAQFGLETGGKALAEELIGELIRYWQSEAYNETGIEIAVSGCSERELASVETALRGFPASRVLRLRYIEGPTAVYDLEMTGTVQDLRASLDKKQELGLALVSLTANRVALKKGAQTSQIAFAPPAPKVEITGFKVDDIFPARLRYYEIHPIAHLSLKSGERSIDNIKISVNIPELMEMPAETRLPRLAAGDTSGIPLSLVFLEKKLFAGNETRTVYAKVIVSYSDNGESVERTLTAPVKVYEKNAMDWRVPQAIGSYVTYRDPAVNDVARAAMLAIPTGSDLNRDLVCGMALFEAMRARNITYVKNPVVAPIAAVLDHVQFPYETFASRTGNCDCLSVLYAALLSAVGIPAAIISYTDHVLVMFDTGIFEKNRYSLAVNPSLAIAHNGTLWIPVETTLLKKSFDEAWYTAAVEFNTALSEGQPLGIIDLAEAWKTFPPASLPAHETVVVPQNLTEAVAASLALLNGRIHAGVENAVREIESQESKPGIAQGDATRLQTQLGILKVRSGDRSGGLAVMKKSFDRKATPGAESNYASALLITGDDASALKRFNAVYKKDTSGRIAVNRALCLFTAATDSQGVEAFVTALREAAAMMPSSAALGRILGINLDDASDLKAAGEHEIDRQKAVNLRRLKELIRKRVLSKDGSTVAGSSTESSTGTRAAGTTTETSTGTRADKQPPMVMPFGGIRGADPDQIAKIIDLLCWFEE
jgi:hypothetical protein